MIVHIHKGEVYLVWIISGI